MSLDEAPADVRSGGQAPDVGPALAELALGLGARAGCMLAVKDAADGRYLWVNDAMAEFLGRPAVEVAGCSDAELIEPPVASLLRTAEQTALALQRPLTSEHRFDWRGERREWSVLRVCAQDGTRRLLCSLWEDLGPQKQREGQLKAALEQLEQEQKACATLRREMGEQRLRDAATGLASPAHFDDQMRRELDLSTREHREFALVYMEIDPLSERAAAFGERALERIHEAMGRLLRGNTRAMDASCRVSGQRFAVLLSGVGLATAHSRMEGLRRQCATQLVVIDGQEFGFTVSMGVASYPHTAHGQEEVMAACDAALTEARKRGGNNVALAAIRFGD